MLQAVTVACFTVKGRRVVPPLIHPARSLLQGLLLGPTLRGRWRLVRVADLKDMRAARKLQAKTCNYLDLFYKRLIVKNK